MTSFIEQLQAGATDNTFSVAELLRKAKIAAVKLDLNEFLEWIEKELNGYSSTDEVPSYRSVSGEVKGWNPYHGWQPVVFGNPETQKLLSERKVGQPVGGLQDLLEGKGGNGSYFMAFPAEIEKKLRDGFDIQPPNIKLHIDRSQVSGILDAVRNVVLDWSLKLEKEGITGEGLSFSLSEKEKAQKVQTVYHIEKIDNLLGNIGPVSEGGTINIKQINNENSEELKKLNEQISKYVNELGLKEEKKGELRTIADDMKTELAQEEIKPTRIKELLISVRNILEGAAGNVIAQGILVSIAKFIGPM